MVNQVVMANVNVRNTIETKQAASILATSLIVLYLTCTLMMLYADRQTHFVQ